MTCLNYIGFFTLLSFSLVACGGDSGDDGESTATTTAAASTGDDATAAASTGEAPTTGDADTSGDPDTTDPDTTDPGTDTGTTGDPTGGTADCEFDPGLAFERLAEVYQLISADGETCVWLERRDDSKPGEIYKAVPFTLLQFKAGHAGVVDHLTDMAALSWESTHHNWTDVGEAWDASVRYRLEDWYTKDGAFADRFGLFAYDEQTDALLWGPIELTPYTP